MASSAFHRGAISVLSDAISTTDDFIEFHPSNEIKEPTSTAIKEPSSGCK